MKIFNMDSSESINRICGNKQKSPLVIIRVKTNKTFSTDLLHYHPESYEYYIYLKGKVILNINNNKIEAKQGDIICIEPGEKHKVETVLEEIDCIIIRNNSDRDYKILLE